MPASPPPASAFARRLRAAGERPTLVCSALSGAAMVVFAVAFALHEDQAGLLQRFAILSGWVWIAVLGWVLQPRRGDPGSGAATAE